LPELIEACDAARVALDTVSEISPDFIKLSERAATFCKLARQFGEGAATGNVRWIDLTPHQCRLVESPLDIREALRQQMDKAPKRQLMQQFLAQPRSVLVGSQSFWEGIDVVGDALQCVLIDKLPFPPPNDPLVEARVKRLESEGRNPFADYFVAEAAVSLKQ